MAEMSTDYTLPPRSNLHFILLLRPGRGAEYCDQFVSLSVREDISGTAGLMFTKFVAQIPCGRGSVLLGSGGVAMRYVLPVYG